MRLPALAFAALALPAPAALTVLPGGSVRVSNGNVSADFAPAFTLLLRETDPGFAVRPNRVPGVPYSVETWRLPKGKTAAREDGRALDPNATGDGWDPRILRGDQDGRTSDLFAAAGKSLALAGQAAASDNGSVTWRFPDNPLATLSATLSEPDADGPLLEVVLTPKKDGWWSAGYTGAPAVAPDAADEFFQPPLWTRRRFPVRPYLTTHRATLPAALVTAAGKTTGVIADPSLIPFQPLPTFDNTRFGVALRDPAGLARPMLFSPALGGAGSRARAGEPLRFALRLVVLPGGMDAACERLARSLYGVRDFRENSLCSLNTTLDNLIDYALSPFALYNEELRGSSYETDVPGAVNNVTGLHPLSLALAFDREDIYRRRALPMIEAGLSRTKRLFADDPKITGQHADWTLNGPNMISSELAALAAFSQKRAKTLADLALADNRRGNSIIRNLEIFRLTGDPARLARARAAADADIQKARAAEADPGSLTMWTSRTRWIQLMDLFAETGERRWLDAAVRGAREYTRFLWMCPKVPDGDITVNPGGKAPLYWYMAAKKKTAIATPETRVPAWRASEIGLVSEGPSTSTGHRGVFLAVPMTWLLRAGQAAGIPFFQDLARDALVGRSENFPGYHLNTARTNVYELRDYPLRPLKELSYNSFHYNHIWPHAAMLFDYLVTDVEGLSNGRVRFPGHFAECYAYLASKVYGAEPGRFYDRDDAHIWMPRGLVQTGNIEVNWLAARSGGGLCLALANQSHRPQKVTVRLDKTRLPAGALSAILLTDAGREIPVVDGALSLELPPRGLAALRVPGVDMTTTFQRKILGGSPAPAGGSLSFDFGGTGAAHLLAMGDGLRSGYAFLRAKPGELKKASIEVLRGGRWETFSDDAYPHEFSVPLADGEDFVFRFKITPAKGAPAVSPEYRVASAPRQAAAGK
ncbi:MAG: hypothetical protein LBR12_05220 [Opitutaceae bacterium]|jgi:hypothetical protein|nr:hypothetical protein [Opitutaceae bacterium]